MKNIVITGASKGIGLAIVNRLASEGCNILFCSRTMEDGLAILATLESQYPNQSFYFEVCDIRQPDAVKAFAQKSLTLFDGKIDVLINNGGVFLPGLISEEQEGNLELMVETNLYSAYHLTRELIPSMKSLGKGHVINMCSIASQIAYPNGGSYSISKFALLGFSKVLREEMKPHNIKVTSIMPGATWSDSWSGVDLPQERLMQADDIALIVSCALNLSDSATMEDVVIRPQLGDL